MTHVTNPIATPWGFKNVSPMGLTNFQMYYYPHEVDTVHKARGWRTLLLSRNPVGQTLSVTRMGMTHVTKSIATLWGLLTLTHGA